MEQGILGQDKNDQWQQGNILELEITDLSSGGDGVGRWQDRVVFIANTVPGDRVQVRLVRTKRHYGQGKLLQVLQASPQRVRPPCIVADKCGGCQWQPVAYAAQLAAKRNQVIQALERIGEFSAIAVEPVLAAPASLGYRNKVTYPLAVSQAGQVQAGYYRHGSHQIVNLNQCPVQDPHFDPLLAQIKQDIQQRGWSIYDETGHQGHLRHLSLRIGRRTREMLLTLVSTIVELPGIAEQAQQWLDQYPHLAGVALNHNPAQTNRIFGDETHCIAGQSVLHEEFAGLTFQLQPQTFFQVHTEQAEVLLQTIEGWLDLQGHEHLLDAYCGIGTLTLPLARRVKQAIGIEVQPAAVAGAIANAMLNQIPNAIFQVGTVETILPKLLEMPDFFTPDIVLLDPPRKGCDARVLDAIRQAAPTRVVYVSCNPATLARDLKHLCQEGLYQIRQVQPVDFFPHTHHVECAVLLTGNRHYRN